MAIIVEVTGRNGQVLRSQVFDKDRITIGRGYQCDLVLADPHVDAEHLVVEHNPATGALVYQDRQTVNGTWAVLSRSSLGRLKKKKVSGNAHAFSGQSLTLGRTFLRILSSQHRVPKALPISRWEAVEEALSRWWLCSILALALVAMQAYDSYLSAPQTSNLIEYMLSALYMLFAAVFYGGFWIVVGRNLGVDAKFTTQFSIALIALLLVSFLQFTLPFWLYNFNMWHFGKYLSQLISAATLLAAVYVTLVFVSRLRPFSRLIMAAVVPVALAVPLLLDIMTRAEFDPVPNYNRALVAPGWQMRPTVTPAEFLRDVQGLHRDTPETTEEALP